MEPFAVLKVYADAGKAAEEAFSLKRFKVEAEIKGHTVRMKIIW